MERLFIVLCALATFVACSSVPDDVQAPSNKDVPQHFTMSLEVAFEKTESEVLHGSLMGVMTFDESLQILAKGELEDNRENRTPIEVEALNWIVTGFHTVPISGFTVAYGNQKTTTDEVGMFELRLESSAPTIDIMYYDVEQEKETVVVPIEVPDTVGTTTQMIPLNFDHQFPHGHALHDHAKDHGNGVIEGALAATQTVPSLACRKCNGWWDWDGGRTGSDCFIALNYSFAPCWAELMNQTWIMKGAYCNGSKNCSKVIGHGWKDNHTHGSSKWTCTK